MTTYSNDQWLWYFEVQKGIFAHPDSHNLIVPLSFSAVFGDGETVDLKSERYLNFQDEIKKTNDVLLDYTTHYKLRTDQPNTRINSPYDAMTAWMAAIRDNLSNSSIKRFHYATFMFGLMPGKDEEKNPKKQKESRLKLGTLLNNTIERDLFFKELYDNDLLGYFYLFTLRPDSYAPYAPEMVMEWCEKQQPAVNISSMLLNTPIPDTHAFLENRIAMISVDTIMKSYVPPAVEATSVPAQSQIETPSLQIEPANTTPDIDAIIAEKQKWFDETSPIEIMNAYARQLDVNQQSLQRQLHNSDLSRSALYSGKPRQFVKQIDLILKEKRDYKVKKFLFIDMLIACKSASTKSYVTNLQNLYDNGTPLMNAFSNLDVLRAGTAVGLHSSFSYALSNEAQTRNKKQWTISLLDSSVRTYMFDAMKHRRLLPELYFVLNAKDSYAPSGISEKLAEYCTKHGIDLKQLLVDYTLPHMDAPQPTVKIISESPELMPAPVELTPTDGITIVDVDGTLVEVGQATQMLGLDRQGDDEPKKPRTFIDHIKWLTEDVRKLMPVEGNITVYQSRQEAAKGTDQDFSHKVIEFKTTDGRTHQIATNNWYGGGTYVIKPPVEIDTSAPKLVHIPDLLGSGKAWPIRCHNREQYTRSAFAHCQKTLEELEPYVPKMAWANKAYEVTQTCIALLKETGERIKTNDLTTLQTGPLHGLTKIGRMAAAINNGAIVNIKADSVPDFYKKLFEEHPGLEAHLHKTKVPAAAIFNDAVAYIRTHDIVPQQGFLDDIKLADMPAEKLSHFFSLPAEGCVVGWRDVVKDARDIPPTLDDFMVASGLAVRVKSGALYPNYDHPALSDLRPSAAYG